jgi:threonine dehydrogenase-like Zn-dependent dehydrogenase
MGPHASHAIVGAERVTRVPEGLTSGDAAWSTLIAIVLNAVRLAPIQLGDSVAVVGLGPIGQLAAQLARLSGGRPVVGFDPIERRRLVAAECGAHAAVDPERRPDGLAGDSALWTDRGFDFVFEATGSPAAFNPALRLAAPGGRVVLLGSTRGLVESFDPYRDVHVKGVTLVGAHANTAPTQATRRERWTEAENRRFGLELIADGSLRVGPLVSHTISAADAPEAFAELAHDRSAYLAVTLTWRGD